jgi:hypothetical protein
MRRYTLKTLSVFLHLEFEVCVFDFGGMTEVEVCQINTHDGELLVEMTLDTVCVVEFSIILTCRNIVFTISSQCAPRKKEGLSTI